MVSAAATALVCALAALNRSEQSLPRIEILDTAPPYVSVGTEAFVRQSTRTIYLIATSRVVQEAAMRRDRCGDPAAVKKLASVLVHEEYHLLHGPDERAAYQRQLVALQELGLAPGSPVYHEVQMSMLRVIELRKRNPDMAMMTDR
jgi:hypothetical protein